MALTVGTGPFGKQSGGTFNFEVGAPRGHALYFKDSPRRVRAVFNGQTIAESDRVKMLHETDYLPPTTSPSNTWTRSFWRRPITPPTVRSRATRRTGR